VAETHHWQFLAACSGAEGFSRHPIAPMLRSTSDRLMVFFRIDLKRHCMQKILFDIKRSYCGVFDLDACNNSQENWGTEFFDLHPCGRKLGALKMFMK